jgi:hypothetical protein
VSIKKTQLGCGWVVNVSKNRVSIKTDVFFGQTAGFCHKKKEFLMKIREKSFKTAKIDRRIAQSRWV